MKLTSLVLLFGLCCNLVNAQPNAKKMPPENVVHVPAIGAGLCVSNVFQSHMVLQRDKPLKIWGWAKPNETVDVSFAGQTQSAKAAADRSWSVMLEPIPANNKPQQLTIKGASETLTLDDILVGDIWVLGGQSNMEFSIAQVDDGELEIASANFPNIRLLTIPQGQGFKSVPSFERLHEYSSWSSRHFEKGNWEICTPKTVTEFSAIGYVFGRRIHMATQVPIGLIDASVGGTTVETWTPEDVIQQVTGQETRDLMKEWADKIAAFDPQADFAKRVENYEKKVASFKAKNEPVPGNLKKPLAPEPGPAEDRNRPGYCYASMIKPLTGFAVKGAVFHQGFNNCFNGTAGAKMYYHVFGRMITSWRNAFADPKLPFCIISLCTAGDPQTHENFFQPMYDAGSYIREAQYQTFRDFYDNGDRAIGFASSFDLRKSWYHPQIKIPNGERAAKWAIVTQYGLIKDRDADGFWLPPTIQKTEMIDNTIRLTMSTTMKTKDDSEGKMVGFGIAGEDRIFHPAEVSFLTADADPKSKNKPAQQKNILVLSSPHVSKPMYYRYAWSRNPMANLVSNQGVTLPAQRNDNWPMEETPIPASNYPEQKNWDERAIRNLQIKAMQKADQERAVKDAEALLNKLKPDANKSTASAGK